MESIEEQIFSWTEYEDYGDGLYSYAICTLLVDLPDYKAGSEFPLINISYSKSQLEIFDTTVDVNAGTPNHTYKLVVSVVKQQ